MLVSQTHPGIDVAWKLDVTQHKVLTALPGESLSDKIQAKPCTLHADDLIDRLGVNQAAHGLVERLETWKKPRFPTKGRVEQQVLVGLLQHIECALRDRRYPGMIKIYRVAC